MEVLAFDYGDKRIGYAVASKKMKMAFAKDYILNDHSLDESVKRIISLYQPDELVVGLPLRQNLMFTPATDKALLFSKWLFEFANCPVYLVDERYSTVYSQTSLRYAGRSVKDSKNMIDSESAKSIAEIYLQSPAWVFKFNLDCLPEKTIEKCIQREDIQTLYVMGGKGIFDIMGRYQKNITVYELNPFIYSLERNKKIPKNIKQYLFSFSVPNGYTLCQQSAHGSTG
ncbi:MAG: Holliday junction resolvase RuvX [Thermotogota bacterium]